MGFSQNDQGKSDETFPHVERNIEQGLEPAEGARGQDRDELLAPGLTGEGHCQGVS